MLEMQSLNRLQSFDEVIEPTLNQPLELRPPYVGGKAHFLLEHRHHETEQVAEAVIAQAVLGPEIKRLHGEIRERDNKIAELEDQVEKYRKMRALGGAA